MLKFQYPNNNSKKPNGTQMRKRKGAGGLLQHIPKAGFSGYLLIKIRGVTAGASRRGDRK